MSDGTDGDGPTTPASRVTVYWRPGCPFCGSLRRGLRRAGLPTHDVDIWSDPTAAGFVRQHAHGNETVPTVDVAGTVLVNPTVRQVVTAASVAGVEAAPRARRRWRRRT